VKPVIVHSRARTEIHDAVDHYNEQRLALGDRFALVVEEGLNRISRQPKAFSPCRKYYRKFVLSEFSLLDFLPRV